MIFHRYHDLFEICWPVFWPWLWLQLAALCAQKAEDGRERLIMGTWWGKIYVLAVGDDPNKSAMPRNVPSEGALRAALAAKFPGDTAALAARAEAALCAFAPRLTQTTPAPATPAALSDPQDKTRILAPG